MILLSACTVFAQSPVVHRAAPLGVPPGRATVVELFGERLDAIGEVWTCREDVRAVLTNEARLVLTPQRGAAGPIPLRVSTTNGVSEIFMVLVDALATVESTATNHSLHTPHRLAPPIAVDAFTSEVAADFFSFDARKGQSVSLEVVASRVGSRLDPVLRVLDAKGREVAFCEDSPGAGRDPRIHVRVPASGLYLAEVRDIGYSGGPQNFYRLRIGRFPFPTCTYPLTASNNGDLAVLGTTGERHKIPAGKWRSVGYVAVDGSYVAVRDGNPAAQAFEREPNDAGDRANAVALPAALNGRFERALDRDWFAFSAEKDQRWVFETRSRAAGSPCDVFLELRDANGKVIAESNPAGPNDTSLTNRFRESGKYFLVARELADRGGPDLAYQIDTRLFSAGFALAVDEDKFEAKSGGEFSINVACTRYEFTNEIALRLEGLPEDFTLENTRIGAGKTNTSVKVKLPATVGPGDLLAFRIVGRSGEMVNRASTLGAIRRNFPLMLHPPAQLDGVVVLGVTGSDPAPKPRRRRT